MHFQTKTIFKLFTTLFLTQTIGCAAPDPDEKNPIEDLSQYNSGAIRFETSRGFFVIELYKNQAPKTTENFMRYVDDGFYDGSDGKGATIFHRTINDFMIQGGGIRPDGEEKNTYDPIENEAATSGLSNVRGTVVMARTGEPDSATSQFFINTMDNVYLDPGEATEDGYAVFGLVTSGMDVVDEISEVEVDGNDRPLTDVVIRDVWVVE